MSAAPPLRDQAGDALQLLCAMGWRTLGSEAALAMRGSTRGVILRTRLIEVLRTRRFDYKGERHRLSPGAIEQIVRQLQSPSLTDGLLTANERIYRMLTLGVTVTEFMPDGKRHQPTIALIDWGNASANRWDVTRAPAVLSAHGTHHRTPDLVGYVNGLPLVVIETGPAARDEEGPAAAQAVIARHLRHQRADEIPQLFVHAQLLLAGGAGEARYGTTGTPQRFWACWREEDDARSPAPGSRSASALDCLVSALLRPQRLLELLHHFVLFDRKVGKVVARHQQFFGVRALLQRVQQRRPDGARLGGVLWHTAGSGKSYTMVFFAKALLSSPATRACRLLVVTDRIELENQLARNFHDCGALGTAAGARRDSEGSRVGSGRELAQRIGHGRERIVFTLIHKFATAARLSECYNPSADIVVLADEGHRSHGGTTHAHMRRALPRAACLAFTGTPLLHQEKTSNPFGPIVHAYTVSRAIGDGAVLPLLYEERVPAPDVDASAVSRAFDAITTHLTAEQRAALKRRLARRRVVQGADGRIALIAWDIAQHFVQHYRPHHPGLKGQVATASKSDAIRFHRHLDATGLVRSAIVMSPPDAREGSDDAGDPERDEVRRWWLENVGRHVRTYEERVLRDFGSEGGPDLIIVVDRLLTGFDEPRNAVLYIDKPLKAHNLMQAVARVNRLHEAKPHGLLVDYRGILRALDTAMRDYQDLEARTQAGYDVDDIVELVRPAPAPRAPVPACPRPAEGERAVERQLRALLDEQVQAGSVREPEGVYRVQALGQGRHPPAPAGVPAPTEASCARAPAREGLAVDAPAPAAGLAPFGDLLRQALVDAQAPFDRPLPRETQWQAFEPHPGDPTAPDLPPVLSAHPRALGWFGVCRRVLDAELLARTDTVALAQMACEIDAVVQAATAEYSLDARGFEASVRQALLPRLFVLLGPGPTHTLLEHVVHLGHPDRPGAEA